MKKLLLILLIPFVLIGCNVSEIDELDENLEETFKVFNNLIYLDINEGVGIPVSYDNIEDDRIQLSFSNDSILEYDVDYSSIKAIKYGYTKVFVEVLDSEFSGEFEVYVEAKEVTTPIIKATNNHINVGSKFGFYFDNNDKVGAGIGNFDYTFNDNSLAILDDNYLITPQKVGDLEVTATLKTNPEITSKFTVKIVEDDYPERLIITSENSVLSLKPGETTQLYIDSKVENMAEDYQFHSYRNDIASITSEGKVIATKEGIAYFSITEKSTRTEGYIYIVIDSGTNTKDYLENMVSLALSQDGYRATIGKYTKYGEWFEPTYAFYDWCAMFVAWNANEVGIPNKLIPRSARVSDIRTEYEKQGRFQLKENYIPKRGDLILFLSDGASHIGIVTGSDSERVYTIEGNTSNMVAQKSYLLDHSKITGYATPNYNSLNK